MTNQPKWSSVADPKHRLSFGARVAHLRRQTNRTQSDLAEEAGVSQSFVSKIEQMDKAPAEGTPSFGLVLKVVDALGLTLDEITSGAALTQPVGVPESEDEAKGLPEEEQRRLVDQSIVAAMKKGPPNLDDVETVRKIANSRLRPKLSHLKDEQRDFVARVWLDAASDLRRDGYSKVDAELLLFAVTTRYHARYVQLKKATDEFQARMDSLKDLLDMSAGRVDTKSERGVLIKKQMEEMIAELEDFGAIPF